MITQRTLARTAAGVNHYGFFLQSRLGTQDGDPTTSDGIFVFMGSFTSLIGGYPPTLGDEVILRARVSEFSNLAQLSSASLVKKLASGVDVATEVEVTDAVPPADLAASVAEGDQGMTSMIFTVRVSRPLSEPVMVYATTVGLTAAGSDYDLFAGCKVLATGETSLTFTVSVRGDRKREADETLSFLVAGIPGLRLADPIAVGTIVNDG